MEVSPFPCCFQHSSIFPRKPLASFSTGKSQFIAKRNSALFPCRCSLPSSEKPQQQNEGRRALFGYLLASTGIAACDAAEAVSTSRRALRGAKVPEDEFKTLPNGLKYYDLKVGGGPEAVKGSRVAVRFVPLIACLQLMHNFS
ncbi:unnamed protein product [Linum tenue]|uniref:Peptidylprolyl isomerase n=1 Tax=Linum tenue TaxID=586396 RepID=A0AAV0PEF8_9ROSI|nr:unnamed protein product [Linum tenue]